MPKKKANPIVPSGKELDYAKFGNTLRELIKSKGYTQAVFAEAIGISYPYMLDILSGKRRVQLKTYYKILDVLEITDLILINEMLTQAQVLERSKLLLELMPIMCELSNDELDDLLRFAKRIAH